MYKAGVWQSITELNKLSLFSQHDYFCSISWRFVLADKAKRFVAMTPEEKKESTCRLYAKVFQSDEALHVGILQKTKKWYQFEFFLYQTIIFKTKNNSWYFFFKNQKIISWYQKFDFFYIKKLFSDIRKYLIIIDFFHIKKHTPKNQLYFLI